MCMGVLPEEAALGMDGPEGLARVGDSGEAQGKSGRGGKGVWELGMTARAQVLEAWVRWLSFLLQAWAVSSRSTACVKPSVPSPGTGPRLQGLPEGSMINHRAWGTQSPSTSPSVFLRGSDEERASMTFGEALGDWLLPEPEPSLS